MDTRDPRAGHGRPATAGRTGQAGRVARRRLMFQGTVQGVGFRPTVYRAAVELGLGGFVQNRRSEVVAEVQGPERVVDGFWEHLRTLLPRAARVDHVRSEVIDAVPGTSDTAPAFRILDSRTSDYVFPPIPPDLALCEDCRRELLDPENRRYLYPFITCTQCGPRYSIVEDTPFDRENTSMADFRQCPACLSEYGDPMDRRFHSQTNSCAVCGPVLELIRTDGSRVEGDPVVQAVRALREGRVMAVQGIGGFHLAADPSRPGTIPRLRSDKERERKPFALMVRDPEEARRLCLVRPADERTLRSPESPILILPVRSGAPAYLEGVSETRTLGLMLPYTPLHLLLFFHPEEFDSEDQIPYRHLVMTSGNLRGEPIITGAKEALRKLSGVADLFLVHNRRIVFRTDDSVLRPPRGPVSAVGRTTAPAGILLRRSRGFVPRLIRLQRPVRTSTLALGGDLKNAPAFAREDAVHLAPYTGDLDNLETMEAFRSHVEEILRLYGARPKRLVFDAHPLYRSTGWAESRPVTPGAPMLKVRVQHHHAHILSVMAEHGLEETLGLAFDGTGYGGDGTIWGGEFLHATRGGFSRLGSFRPFRLPGGEAAVLHPKRIALAILHGAGAPENDGGGALGFDDRELALVDGMLERGIRSPLSSAAGRIFDAAAAVLGLVDTVSYEGEGPILLEGLAEERLAREGRMPAGGVDGEELFPLAGGLAAGADGQALPEGCGSTDGPFRFDPRPAILTLLHRRTSVDPGALALLFHRAVASACLRGSLLMREATGVSRIALSGGVFQNRLLRVLLVPLLEADGFSVYTNTALSPGDGGLAVGQVYYTGDGYQTGEHETAEYESTEHEGRSACV